MTQTRYEYEARRIMRNFADQFRTPRVFNLHAMHGSRVFLHYALTEMPRRQPGFDVVLIEDGMQRPLSAYRRRPLIFLKRKGPI